MQGSGASQVKQLFSYDANGDVVSINYNGTEYYYLRNGQTDIVGLMDGSGNRVVEYTYDAWGKLISTTGTLASTLGADNPFRYRGYYYDTETGLYYLMTRYYDPEVCRFISADVYMTTGQGVLGGNMWAYCGNSPVIRYDDGGELWHLIIGAAIGVATQYIADVASNLASGKSFGESLKPTSSWVEYTAAAASGALAASGVGLMGSIVGNAAISGTAYFANCDIANEEPTWAGFGVAVGSGIVSGLVGGKGANGNKLRGIYRTSKDILKTAVSAKKIAMYTTKIVGVKKAVINATARTFAAGCSAYAIVKVASVLMA
ncbi:MAG: RHS repeat-associated core domain-containing protein [Christensenellales bacterium]